MIEKEFDEEQQLKFGREFLESPMGTRRPLLPQTVMDAYLNRLYDTMCTTMVPITTPGATKVWFNEVTGVLVYEAVDPFVESKKPGLFD